MSAPPPYGMMPLPSTPQQMPLPPAPQQMPYAPAPQQMPYAPVPQQDPTVVNIQPTTAAGQPLVAGQTIVAGPVGNCPACRIGFLRSEYTLAGILLAIFCFPWGFFCCWAMQERVCPHCGATWNDL